MRAGALRRCVHRSFLAVAVLVLGGCSPLPAYVLGGEPSSIDGGVEEAGDANLRDSGTLNCTHCLVFTSSWSGPGDVLGAAGIEIADGLCTQLGTQIPGKLNSVWKAFLWTRVVDPFARIKSPPGGWYSVKRKDTQQEFLVLARLDVLKNDFAQAALAITDKGEDMDSPMRVWTGGGATRTEENCQNWQSAGSDFGTYGNPADGTHWGEAGKWVCNASGRLYCLEQ